MEFIKAQGRILPAKAFLYLMPGCDLDIWVLHHNHTHMARYLPSWRPPRAWIAKLRLLHPIEWERIRMYAPFPVEEHILEEFGETWATPIEYRTWHDKTKDYSALRTPINAMKDTVFIDCGYRYDTRSAHTSHMHKGEGRTP